MKKSLTLLLPAYNEAASLTAMRPGLLRLVDIASQKGMGVRVIVVDDGSSDDTAMVASQLPKTQVIKHRENRGLAEALRTLLRTSLADSEPSGFCVIMDADNTMDPVDAIDLVEALAASNGDVAIASRFAAGGTYSGVPVHRAVLSQGASIVFRLWARVPNVRDYTCGFRAYRMTALANLQRNHKALFNADGFSASVELLLRLHRLGATIIEVPFHLRYDKKAGASKIRLWRTMREYGRLFITLTRGFSWLP